MKVKNIIYDHKRQWLNVNSLITKTSRVHELTFYVI